MAYLGSYDFHDTGKCGWNRGIKMEFTVEHRISWNFTNFGCINQK